MNSGVRPGRFVVRVAGPPWHVCWAPASFVIGDDVYLIQGMSYDPGTFEYMETNKFALVPEVAEDVALESFVGGELICGAVHPLSSRKSEPGGREPRPAHLGNAGG